MAANIPEQFLDRLKTGELTDKDYQEFESWARTADEQELEAVIDAYADFHQMNVDRLPFGMEGLLQKIESSIDHHTHLTKSGGSTGRTRKLRRTLSAAAAILIAFGCGLWFHISSKPGIPLHSTASLKRKIVPGGNHAVLTMSNGISIVLDSAKNGMLTSTGNVAIYKAKNGQLIFDAKKARADQANNLGYNTVSTPRGGQYQVLLADGTKVWLNAESSLRFPVAFNTGERLVELTGEGYFEVAKDKARLFKVKVNDMEVRVYGTHFNIMGYHDEGVTKTTLLEGSVKIVKGNQEQAITPGQQANVSTGIKVIPVNVSEAVEWKNGNFNFSHEKIESIMRKIARWYDVDVEYRGKPTDQTFIGTIPRKKSISEVLNTLQLTDLVHFKLQERRVIVMP